MKKHNLANIVLTCLLSTSTFADPSVRDSLSITELYGLISSQNTEPQLSPIEKEMKLMEYFGYAPDLVVSVAATYYHKAGDYEKALECKTRAIELNPTDPGSYLSRAITYASLKKDKLAEKDYEKALSINPKYKTTYSERGSFLIERNRFAEAEIDYRKLLELDPDEAVYHYKLGRALFGQEKYQDALREYTDSLESPTATKLSRSLALLGRARTYDALGEHDKAFSDQALAKDPENTSIQLEQGTE